MCPTFYLLGDMARRLPMLLLGRRVMSTATRLPRLDFRNLRPAEAQVSAAQRKVECDAERVAHLYRVHVALTQELETLHASRNKNTDVAAGKELKEAIRAKTAELAHVDADLEAEAAKLPNSTSIQTPVGPEECAVELHRRDVRQGSEGADHVALLKRFDWADFESAAAATGEGFVYLKRDVAFLELALVQLAMQRAQRRGWAVHTTPDMARDRVVAGCGFRPRASAASPIYSIAEEDVSLVGTAEIALAGLWANKIINIAQQPLPVKVAGFCHSFRRETGQGGRGSRGLYRLHQFSKVELFALTAPEQSESMLEEMVAFQMELLGDLELPFRVLEMPSEELGLAAHRKVDCEVFMPSRQGYGEVSSASNCTDFQSRRLNIRYQVAVGSNRFVHTLNATALAVPRIIIALLETHYDAASDCVRLPHALHGLMGCDRIPHESKH
jgi:seryl-tRNA synthetase